MPVPRSSPPHLRQASRARFARLAGHDYLGCDYTAYLHLIRDETGWSIVSKLFNGTPAKASERSS
jgi:hypothetical protein